MTHPRYITARLRNAAAGSSHRQVAGLVAALLLLLPAPAIAATPERIAAGTTVRLPAVPRYFHPVQTAPFLNPRTPKVRLFRKVARFWASMPVDYYGVSRCNRRRCEVFVDWCPVFRTRESCSLAGQKVACSPVEELDASPA